MIKCKCRSENVKEYIEIYDRKYKWYECMDCGEEVYPSGLETTDGLLYNIEYLKIIKCKAPESVDEDAHNQLIKNLWRMYAEESEKEEMHEK